MAVAICRLAEPIAMTAILPYAWLMTKDFGLDDASFYAGILIASYSLSEAAFSMFWGMLVRLTFRMASSDTLLQQVVSRIALDVSRSSSSAALALCCPC